MKIYFIAICGKGVGNLAVFLKKQGHDVYGSEYSEKTFYPYISDLITEAGIPVDFSFDPDKITKDFDLIVIGGAALIHDPKNPQVTRAKELGLKTISWAHGIGEFISKEEQIEVVGNHAKTTTTSLVAWLLNEAGEDASYFIGEAPMGFESSINSGTSKWSVAEGDEHPTLNIEPGGKFMYHKPKHILFTSADWDHKNIYTTEKSYLDCFIDLFKIQPLDGKIMACLDGIKVLDVLEKSETKNPISLYTIGRFKDIRPDLNSDSVPEEIEEMLKTSLDAHKKLKDRIETVYYVGEVDYKWKPDSTRFLLSKLEVKSGEHSRIGYFETSLIGQIGVENSLAALACLINLGFDTEKLKDGLPTFLGAKRRLELIHNREYKVINDYAHSPIKIESSLKSIRTKYYDHHIFVIFNVGQSGLKEKTTFNQLRNVFNLADFVLIPRVNPDLNAGEQFYGKDYRDLIKEGAQEMGDFLEPSNVYYCPLGVQMQSVLENNLRSSDVIVIMSSSDPSELVELTKGLRVNN